MRPHGDQPPRPPAGGALGRRAGARTLLSKLIMIITIIITNIPKHKHIYIYIYVHLYIYIYIYIYIYSKSSHGWWGMKTGS